MKNIKYLATVIAITLLMTACSDYPTSGRISFDKLKTQAKDEFVVNSIETEGYLFEFEGDVFERIEKFEDQFDDLKQLAKKPYNASSYKGFYSDEDLVINAIDAFFAERKEFANKLKIIIEQGKQDKLNSLNLQQKAVDKLQQTQDSFKQYTQAPQQKVDSIDADIKKAQEETNKILDNIIKKTNEVIVAEKLPIKKLSGRYFNLSSRELTMPKNATTCEHSKTGHYNIYQNYNSTKYIVLDERKDYGRCVYINRPHAKVHTPDYDNYIAKEFVKTRNWDEKALKKELKIAKQKLKDAQIIAENQTNIKIYKFNREFDNAKRKLESLKEATQEIDLEKMLQSLGFSALPEGEKRSSDYSYVSSLADVFAEARKIAPSRYDIEDNFRQAIYKYRNTALDELFDDATKEVTEINSDGTFSGLDGSFGYLVLIILLDVEVEIDGRTKSEKGVYTDVLHIKSEKSKIAQMDELLLDPSTGRMKSSKKYKKEGYKSVLFTTLLQYK